MTAMPGKSLIVHPAASRYLSLESLAAAADLHADFVEQLVGYGLMEPARTLDGVHWFEESAVRRLCVIQRLRADLGIGIHSLGVVLDLLERIESLQREVAALRRARHDDVNTV
jgi:hypothetical protein